MVDSQDTISSIASQCRSNLGELSHLIHSPGYRYADFLSKSKLGSVTERFLQWSSNMGAMRQPTHKGSLDARLEDAESIRNFVFGTLKTMKESLEAAISIASETRKNRTTISIETDSELYYADSSSSSTDSENSVPLAPDTQTSEISEIEELGLSIKASVDTLMRTSMFIRRYAVDDKRQRAAKRTPVFDNSYDANYVLERFPCIEMKSPGLARRLGEANARRRQYFKYCREHNERLMEAAEQEPLERTHTAQHPKPRLEGNEDEKKTVVTSLTKPSESAETDATQFQFRTSTGIGMPLTDISGAIEPAETIISHATTIIDTNDSELQFPSLPQESKQEYLSFLCPYCQSFLSLGGRNQKQHWIKHVIKDLQPYICTFNTCTMDTYASQSSWFDHELLVHRCEWRCQFCSHTSFDTAPAYEKHLQQSHHREFTNAQLAAIVESCRRPLEHIAASDCPFCEIDWALGGEDETGETRAVVLVTQKQFREHVGRHLKQLALFALPRLPDDSQDQVSSGKAAGEGSHNSENGSQVSEDGLTKTSDSKFGDTDLPEKTGRGLRLLSIDGGGIRGVSVLQTLKELMKRISPTEPPRPCEYFDMMCGTGTGGLIAMMLGRLRMEVDECIEEYRALTRGLVTLEDTFLRLVEEMIEKYLGSKKAFLVDQNTSTFQIFIAQSSSAMTLHPKIRIPSYPVPQIPRYGRDILTISDAVMKTMKTTAFFVPPESCSAFVRESTNPINELCDEAQSFWDFPNKKVLEENTQCLISIGVGKFSNRHIRMLPNEEMVEHETICNRLNNINSAADEIERQFREHSDWGGAYFRFSASNTGPMLETPDSINDVLSSTARSLETIDPMLAACALRLRVGGPNTGKKWTYVPKEYQEQSIR